MEETKRRKLAIKARKLVELMMVSGIPTASGYEERIRFSEMEIVDRGANEQGLLVNLPEGNFINGWDVNVAGVRTTSVKRNIRYHQHAVISSKVSSQAFHSSFPGVHNTRQTSRTARRLRGQKIRRVCEAPQAPPHRTPRQGPRAATQEEQELYNLKSLRLWRR